MTTQIEDMLTRELHDVAGAVQVPPMPALPTEESTPRVARYAKPLLAAAVVALVIGLVAAVAGRGGDDKPQPAPSPSPTVTDPASVSTEAPTVPYVVDGRLYSGGEQVPGQWWALQTGGEVWLATQSDGSWWWGRPGGEPRRLEGEVQQSPALSPDGRYVAWIDVSSGQAVLTGADTQPAGEGFGAAPIEDLPTSEEGVGLTVPAVTNEGDVFVTGWRTRLMWRAQFEDQRTVVDLAETAPGQRVLQATAAGLVVVDESDGPTDSATTAPYLATVSGEGRIDEVAQLPTFDSVEVSTGGTWLVRSAAGTTVGDVTGTGTLQAQPTEGGDEVVLQAPQGGAFGNSSWHWEDDDNLIAWVMPAGRDDGGQAARCNIRIGDCVLLDDPSQR
ncbi:hypothetical protein [Nocardioides lijunqiniae]|uniref:hypothetical protein n=1 Tax=Nocardioides lijunqiniae TaxID=2760832 RepID=UPI0018786701|nr:hypothetical protein [Nocardioides lijunqiniae]